MYFSFHRLILALAVYHKVSIAYLWHSTESSPLTRLILFFIFLLLQLLLFFVIRGFQSEPFTEELDNSETLAQIFGDFFAQWLYISDFGEFMKGL